jgi:acetoin utilization protein AcuB
MLVMLVKERMNPCPIVIRVDGTLAEARARLDRHRIRHLPVIEDDRLVGIVTDRDIRSVASALPLERLRVGDVMSRPVITVTPETQVQEAAKLMLAHRIGGLPVVKAGTLVGIITETDLLEAFVEIVEASTLDRIAPDYTGRKLTVSES